MLSATGRPGKSVYLPLFLLIPPSTSPSLSLFLSLSSFTAKKQIHNADCITNTINTGLWDWPWWSYLWISIKKISLYKTNISSTNVVKISSCKITFLYIKSVSILFIYKRFVLSDVFWNGWNTARRVLQKNIYAKFSMCLGWHLPKTLDNIPTLGQLVAPIILNNEKNPYFLHELEGFFFTAFEGFGYGRAKYCGAGLWYSKTSVPSASFTPFSYVRPPRA